MAEVYRIEQQSMTIELSGPRANRALAQTCGVDFSVEPTLKIIYTRLAGASCGIIPLGEKQQPVYRIWIDYTFGEYLWDVLGEIVGAT